MLFNDRHLHVVIIINLHSCLYLKGDFGPPGLPGPSGLPGAGIQGEKASIL